MIRVEVADKMIGSRARTIKDLAKKALKEEKWSPFSKRIAEASHSKKFSHPKFMVYNVRLELTTHVIHYKLVMVFRLSNEPAMCRMFPTSLGETVLK